MYDVESETETDSGRRIETVGHAAVGRTRRTGVHNMKGHERINDRAVTPVVGIILLLAITVLLAGTAGAFFFGFADDNARSGQPRATIQFEDSIGSGSDTVTVKHVTGKSIDSDDLYVKIDGAKCSAGGSPDGRYNLKSDFGFSPSAMSAGMTVQVGSTLGPGGTTICSGDLDLSSATIRVVWDNGEGQSGTYNTWEAS